MFLVASQKRFTGRKVDKDNVCLFMCARKEAVLSGILRNVFLDYYAQFICTYIYLCVNTRVNVHRIHPVVSEENESPR